MKRVVVFLSTLLLMIVMNSAYAAFDENIYRQVFGLDSRKVVWFLAQMHLFFGAFVLGVPLFAVIIEIVGWRNQDSKFDKMAHEFSSLLSIAFATTAAFGGLLAFALFTLYPTVMVYMTGVFKEVMFVYALLFFGETFTLYLYYYGWQRLNGYSPLNRIVVYSCRCAGAAILASGLLFFLGYIGWDMRGDTRAFITVLYFLPTGLGLLIIKDLKSVHIFIGLALNVFGTLIMMVANSWVAFMMSPAGVDESGALIAGVWPAFENVLATPLAIHRMLGNLVFGGLVAGAYAAVKFIGAKTDEDKAHYDWMGYISNFVAISGLIILPFAGYYLGREIYAHSPLMGANMMGGDFSWTFILQAMLVGSLFLISNYYLWNGMTRIPGAERYYHYIKYILGAIVISLAVWLTPHNLPLSGSEVSDMGGSQYHPTLQFMGLMPAKNAVINLIIISTFFSFLLYRRGNKKSTVSIRDQGMLPRIGISTAAIFCLFILIQYALKIGGMDPADLNLAPETAEFFSTVALLIYFQCGMILLCVGLALLDRGLLAENLYLGITTFNVTLFLGVYGFVVMETASPFLRHLAVAQFLMMFSSLILVAAIDIFLYRRAEEIGSLNWGKMTNRSQFALLILTFLIVTTMGAMGYVRSALRGDWHIYGLMRDTSNWGFTPSNFSMSQMVSLSVVTFMIGITFMFWLGSLAKNTGNASEEDPVQG